MNDWIRLDDMEPPLGVLLRLKLRDAAGEYESPSHCAMDVDGEFWNQDVDPPVRIEPRVVAWRYITATTTCAVGETT